MPTKEEHQKHLELIEAHLDALTDQVFELEERTLTKKEAERVIFDIWGYCRTHKDSLDSERHFKHIEKVVLKVSGEIQKLYESSQKQLRHCKKKLTDVRKRYKAEVEELKEEIDILNEEKAALQQECDEYLQQV